MERDSQQPKDGEEKKVYNFPPGTVIKKLVTTITETTTIIGKNGEVDTRASDVIKQEEKLEILSETPDDEPPSTFSSKAGGSTGAGASKYDDPYSPKYTDPSTSKYAYPYSPKYTDPHSPKYDEPNTSKYAYPKKLGGSKEDEEVRYESDDENSFQAKRNALKGHGSNFSSHENGSYGNFLRQYSGDGKKNVYQKKMVTAEDLKIFGKISKVQRGEIAYDIIKSYVANSHGLFDKGTVKIRDMYGINYDPSKISKKKGVGKHSKDNKHTMLLWCKTTMETLHRLSVNENSYVAFYDRLCRAFTTPVSQMNGTSQHVILLCSVSLGNMHKSPHGYEHWRKNPFPNHCDSVKGSGRFSPTWQANTDYRGWTVPCGETKRNNRYPTYELDYNEYIVYSSERIKVRFAADIEITAESSDTEL